MNLNFPHVKLHRMYKARHTALHKARTGEAFQAEELPWTPSS
jgi:hypothetical protein